MHFTTAFTAASAFFAVGMAAPQRPNGRPTGRPTRPGTTATTSSTVSSSTGVTSSTVISDPITSSSSTVVVDPVTESASTTSTVSSSTISSSTSSATPTETCMAEEDALIVADTFRHIIQGYTIEMAEAALTEDFVDYTSAVSVIVNKGGSAPKILTEPIFTNRTQFMAGHGSQKGIPFETLNVWHDCNGTVSMRWWTPRSGLGQLNESAANPVVGIAVLETEPAEANNTLGYKYRIHTLYSEFNTASWLVNNGVFKTAPGVINTPVPASKRDLENMQFDRRTAVHEARDIIKGLKGLMF